jgi:hypothetical protein
MIPARCVMAELKLYSVDGSIKDERKNPQIGRLDSSTMRNRGPAILTRMTEAHWGVVLEIFDAAESRLGEHGQNGDRQDRAHGAIVRQRRDAWAHLRGGNGSRSSFPMRANFADGTPPRLASSATAKVRRRSERGVNQRRHERLERRIRSGPRVAR